MDGKKEAGKGVTTLKNLTLLSAIVFLIWLPCTSQKSASAQHRKRCGIWRLLINARQQI